MKKMMTVRELFFFNLNQKKNASVAAENSEDAENENADSNSEDESDGLTSEEQREDEEFFDATDILESLDGKDGRGIQSGDEKKEEIPEYVYYDRNDSVRRFSYDGEQMSARKRVVGVSEDGEEICQTEIIAAFEKKVKRRIFDEFSRLVSSETFSMGASAKDMALSSSRKYSYEGDSKIPSKSSETDFAKKTSVDVVFNEKGLVLSRSDYSISEDEKKKKMPIKKVVLVYDESDRITSEENTVWNGDDKFVRKNIYKYTEISEKPDYEYYEDGILRLSRNYDDEKCYYEKTFMDDGFWILSYFEDGMKFYEIVYLNDVEVRRKYYDF